MERPPSAAKNPAAVGTARPGGPVDRHREAEAITAHLVRHSSGYWAATSQSVPRVELERVDPRSTGTLYWYRLKVGGQPRSVVVKVTDPPRDPVVRLRLAGTADPTGGFRREYAALRMIDEHFAAVSDDRIGNVPILDRIEPSGGIVMERVHGTPMTRLLQRHHRFARSRNPDRLQAVARHAGLWLREFHSVPVPPAVVDRQRRDEFVDWVERYCAHLGRGLGAIERFHEVARLARRAAEATLPQALPIAVAHSDFAKRNVLVQGEARVLVLDTIARRHAPVYEDLASFTVGIRFGRLQLQTYGVAFRDELLVAIDDAFLDGYFGMSPRPSDAFRTYELLVLLDRWAAVLTWGSRGRFGRPARRLANGLLDRELRRALARLS